jgi:GTP-binding protein
MPIIAEFLLSATSREQLPKDRLPEIAFAGRSNVGKSSLINKVIGMPKLARTSNTPGRTQTLNYYRIYPAGKTSKPFYLVDMPGYGFAQVSHVRRAQWGQLIEDYLTTRETLHSVIHLLDMRHPPQPLDIQMSQWLQHFDKPFLVVGTKADKIATTKVPEHLLQIAEGLNVDTDDTLAFSAETGLGRDQLWRWMLESVKK